MSNTSPFFLRYLNVRGWRHPYQIFKPTLRYITALEAQRQHMPSYGARRTSDMAESVNKLEILRIASYHQRYFDLAVIRTDPHGHEKVRSSLLRTIPATSPTVGNLQSLPL